MNRILLFAKPERATFELTCGLGRAGFDAFLLDSSDALLAELALDDVDLVLVDLDLRAPHALDVARSIRSAYPATRVILTGRVPLSERQLERLDCGAARFFPKPFDVRRAGSFMREHLTSMPARRLWHAECSSSYAL